MKTTMKRERANYLNEQRTLLIFLFSFFLFLFLLQQIFHFHSFHLLWHESHFSTSRSILEAIGVHYVFTDMEKSIKPIYREINFAFSYVTKTNFDCAAKWICNFVHYIELTLEFKLERIRWIETILEQINECKRIRRKRK